MVDVTAVNDIGLPAQRLLDRAERKRYAPLNWALLGEVGTDLDRAILTDPRQNHDFIVARGGGERIEKITIVLRNAAISVERVGEEGQNTHRHAPPIFAEK